MTNNLAAIQLTKLTSRVAALERQFGLGQSGVTFGSNSIRFRNGSIAQLRADSGLSVVRDGTVIAGPGYTSTGDVISTVGTPELPIDELVIRANFYVVDEFVFRDIDGNPLAVLDRTGRMLLANTLSENVNLIGDYGIDIYKKIGPKFV